MKLQMERCKEHKNFTIIERIIVENFVEFSDGNPPEDSSDWSSDPILWHNPQPKVIIVTCSDCGFEQFYGPHAKRPKWVQAAWNALMKTQCRDEVNYTDPDLSQEWIQLTRSNS